jgi:hypothetical protein
MRGGAFIRLNGGSLNLTTEKQTKISVAGLLKILRIGRFRRGVMLVKPKCTNIGCICSKFCRVWLICTGQRFL